MKRYILNILLNFIAQNIQKIRIVFFKKLSTNQNIIGKPILNQPTLFIGLGQIIFGKEVNIGIFPSPYFYTGNNHFEARTEKSKIIIGDYVFINNNFVAISEQLIEVGANTLIGTNVEIYDSDFHNINPNKRLLRGCQCIAPVIIKDNVWLGSNVKILKGVTIGQNSVIANGSIVTKNIPDNVLAGGIPAKIIKKI